LTCVDVPDYQVQAENVGTVSTAVQLAGQDAQKQDAIFYMHRPTQRSAKAQVTTPSLSMD